MVSQMATIPKQSTTYIYESTSIMDSIAKSSVHICVMYFGRTHYACNIGSAVQYGIHFFKYFYIITFSACILSLQPVYKTNLAAQNVLLKLFIPK